ncbi:MAG: DUF1080 domain-containing protein, partial [Planctomycetes bacterium]|nr:DUF1080 domain-containing protein [Planctomycetota bacterium]
ESTFGWKTEGDIKVENGELRLGGTKRSSITTTSEFGFSIIRFGYFLNGKASCAAGSSKKEFSDKREDTLRWMEMEVDIQKNGLLGGSYKSSDGEFAMVFGTASPSTAKLSFSMAPVRFEVEAEGKLFLRSIKIKPKGAKLLFNGKDLAGWKVFEDPKRNQSKWTVTPEGWLNVKNGPGDLQTEGKYDNFLLQFECISNGKALNSGIFFRCIANEYQNGYEAQVQNGYKDDDRTKPADFGTGAIYRRVPARKVLSNDNEWFTMTVLANGNHIATWVNGYQTVDWTDDRSADDNPRKGSKTGPGHLSIQGHDPTTDLSFRNIRIEELLAPKK